jgi:hypothetical protein
MFSVSHEIVLLHLTMGGNRIKNYRREDALKTLIDVNQTHETSGLKAEL